MTGRLAPLLIIAGVLLLISSLPSGPPAIAATNPPVATVPHDPPIIRPDLVLGNRGTAVCDAMWLLRGHNAFEIRTYRRTPTGGPTDCLFGPRAARATRDMKWLLGYPLTGVNGRFGRNLRAILMGQLKLPPLYEKRRSDRHRFLEIDASYPVAHRGAICGTPGYGTHSPTKNGYVWQDDNAVDICVAAGTPILAVRAGTICNKLGALHPGSTGRYAGIRFYLCDTRGVRWFYTHARALAPGMRLGLQVVPGQTIAYVGVAGVAHLHFSCEPAPCRTFTGFQHTLGAELK